MSDKVRILIVDDDPIFSEMAETCLTAEGYDVKLAADGVQALEMLDGQKFQLALVDLSMPRIDGFRLIGLIRGAPRHTSVIIVVVSVSEDPQAVEEALALGANDYRTKPVDWRAFSDDIEQLLSMRK